MRRLLPYPLLTASLLLMWLLLTRFSVGQILLGLVIALAASRVMGTLQPAKPRLRRWIKIPSLAWTVFGDILKSNIAVAGLVLRGGSNKARSGFVVVPLELHDRTGLAVLACIITGTPGTAWIEYNAASGKLLMHVLDIDDEERCVAQIKQRYEAPLMEIFE
jgi:multicomponent K+:H+ antiporter subunit E